MVQPPHFPMAVRKFRLSHFPVALLSFDFCSSGWHCSVSYLRISQCHCSGSAPHFLMSLRKVRLSHFPVALLSFDFRSSGWHCSVSYLRIVSYTQASRWHCSVSYLRISQCICSVAHMHTSTWSQCNCSICVGLHAVHGTCVQG